MTVCSSIPGLAVGLCLVNQAPHWWWERGLVAWEQAGEGPGIDVGRTKAGVIRVLGAQLEFLKDSLGSVLPSSVLA